MSLLSITGSVVDNHPQFDLLPFSFDRLLKEGFISLHLQHLQLYYLGDVFRVNEWFDSSCCGKPRVCYVTVSSCSYKFTLENGLTTSFFKLELI